MSQNRHSGLRTRPRLRRLFTEQLEARRLMTSGFELLKNINGSPGFMDPGNFAQVGNLTFFSASTPGQGEELWRTDGTSAGTVLVKDIFAGTTGSSPKYLTNVNGKLYFGADGSSGRELWVSDGTNAGTVLVKNIWNGGSSDPKFLTEVSGQLFFNADDGTHGRELWTSDGMAAGTTMVSNFFNGGSADPEELINVQGSLYFRAHIDATTPVLCFADNTSISIIASPSGASFLYNPEHLTNVGGTLYLSVRGSDAGQELWKLSNGFELVKDISPGPTDSNIKSIHNVNGTAYFTVNRNTIDGSVLIVNSELWRSNASGTFKIVTSNKLLDETFGIAEAGGRVFYTFSGDGQNWSLMAQSADGGGFSALQGIKNPLGLTNVSGTLLFSATDVNGDEELWKSNGDPSNTARVADIYRGNKSSSPRSLTNVNGNLLFSADDGANGRKLWKSNASSAGTSILDVSAGGSFSSSPDNLTFVGDTLFFTADDGFSGNELWSIDKTTGKTQRVSDIQPGAASSTPEYLTNVNGKLFFAATGPNGRELWISDGTTAGTQLVKNIWNGGDAAPQFLVNVDGLLYFSANDGSGRELWKSDGTSAGTGMVKDIVAGGGSNPRSLINVNGTLFFVAFDSNNGYELWKSDGTISSTVQIRDIFVGASSSSPSWLTNVNGTLFFAATDETFGEELWKSNGTTAGTVRVKDIRSGVGASSPSSLVNVGGTLFFTANDGSAGVELWSSNGTSASTTLVRDIVAGATGAVPQNLTEANGIVFFSAIDGVNGRELWRSDGTASGTYLVKDIRVGGGSAPANLTNVNGALYFAANDGTQGRELWRSDGTADGTLSMFDFTADAGDSNPSSITEWDGRLIVSATTTVTGAELFISLSTAPTGLDLSSQFVNEGKPIGSVVGTLQTVDDDVLGRFTYQLVSGVGSADNGAFSIAGNVLKTNSVFNFATKSNYAIRVRATDESGNSFEKNFVIIVNTAPSNLTISSTSVPENSTIGTTVGAFSTTDPNLLNDLYTYTMVTGTGSADNALFTISGNTLRTAVDLDYETRNNYSIHVRSTDQGGLATEQTFTISVSNVNETPTALTLSSSTIDENASQLTIVGAFSSSDPDAGNTFTYALVAGAGNTNNGSFIIVGNTLRSVANFDFETKSSYAVRVRTTDQGGLFTEQTFTITVLDVNEAPTSLVLSSTSVAENSIVGTTVGTFTATDPDAGANTFTYALVAGAGSTDNNKFTISGNTLKTAASFDFESQRSYSIRVATFDQLGLSFQQTFLVSVTDVNEAPIALGISSTIINEGLPSGAVVGTFITIDPDANNTFVYTLVPGSGSTDNASFTILGNTLKTAAVFNFATKSSYSVRVRSTDQSGQLFIEQTYTIQVNTPPQSLSLSSNSIAENSPVATLIGVLQTVDPSVEDFFEYTLVAGAGSADNASFGIVNNTLRNITVFDNETKSAYSVRLRTTDLGGLFTERSFVVTVTNVNEAPTALVLAPAAIAENASVGTTVGNFSTTDPDAGNTHTYALVAGTGSTDNSKFTISGNTLKAAQSFDFEAASSYSIRVATTDQSGLTFQQIFLVSVTDVNEAPTAISLSSTVVNEGLPGGTTVGSFATVDPDANNTFTYTLVAGAGGADNASFTIVGNSLKTAAEFDFATKSSYSVRVRSTDQSGQLYFEETFAIRVNDTPTGIALSATNVNENSPIGTLVGTFTTVDGNIGDNFNYEFRAGNGDADNALFSIVDDKLYTATQIDFETRGSFSIRVRSTDQGNLFIGRIFVITANDLFEAPTSLSLSSNVVEENLAVGASIGNFSTADPDIGDRFTYTFVTGLGNNDNQSFKIVGNELQTATTLHSETQSLYMLRVRTTDLGGLSIERDFEIRVQNVMAGDFELLKNINLSPGVTTPIRATQVGAITYFAGSTPDQGRELWRTDGTATGTWLVSDLNPGSTSSSPYSLTNVNGTLFFTAMGELWKSDGTSAGTVAIRNDQAPQLALGPRNLANVNGQLFFLAADPVLGNELWKSDGTNSGTRLVKDIFNGSNSSEPKYLTTVNGELFFLADDGNHGNELWKSDGTTAGTVLVKDIFGGSAQSTAFNLLNVNGTLFFFANDGIHGVELWKSNGSDAGTVLVSDLAPGVNSSFPRHLTEVNGSVYFSALNKLWKSDGTNSGTSPTG